MDEVPVFVSDRWLSDTGILSLLMQMTIYDHTLKTTKCVRYKLKRVVLRASFLSQKDAEIENKQTTFCCYV